MNKLSVNLNEINKDSERFPSTAELDSKPVKLPNCRLYKK